MNNCQSEQELRDNIDERVANLQDQVRFCTYDYTYHHKNDDLEILAELSEQMRQSKVELMEMLKQVQQVEALTANVMAKCDVQDMLLTNDNKCVVKKERLEDGEQQHLSNGYDSNKES